MKGIKRASLFNRNLLLFLIFSYNCFGQPNASVTSVTFDKTQVISGIETITATMTIENIGNSSGTFYVAASLQNINGTWYDFLPTISSKTLCAGSSRGSFTVSWSPGSGVPVGSCRFYVKVFKSSSGSDYYNDYEKSSAFSVIAGTV